MALALGLAAAAFLAGCSDDTDLFSESLGGVFGSRADFGGIVVADEPRAAVAARDVLQAGGNAADAAVTLYFTLAVTLPSSASLGGGGMCLIHDPQAKKVEALDFMPRAAAEGGLAVPASARAMGALHARFGRLPWAQLLGGPEQMARLGVPTSRALARELATAGEGLLRDEAMRSIFAPHGHLLEEGEPLQQIELASVLAQLRQRGAADLNTGHLATTFVDAVRAMGGSIDVASMRDTTPRFVAPVRLPVGNHVLDAAPPPAAGGALALELIAMLTGPRHYADASDAEKPHLLVEAMKRAFADRARWMRPDGSSSEPAEAIVAPEHAAALMQDYSPDQATPISALPAAPVGGPENPWATGFVVADREGRAVACNVTLNQLFGTGRMVPGMGIVVAPAPGDQGAGAIDLGPMLLVNEHTGAFYYGAAASGGTTAPTAMAQVFLRSVIGKQPLSAAIAAKRLHHNGEPDIVFVEPGESPEVLDALHRLGHRTEEAQIIGRVAAVWCSGGMQAKTETCQAMSDPRADGLALLLLNDESGS
ncbi:MAG: gamma-glutamyltransferase [Rhodospirillaceae bacterium]|nr:gamma-glutamyltransferase [Rhodospirillaceae bacterium]